MQAAVILLSVGLLVACMAIAMYRSESAMYERYRNEWRDKYYSVLSTLQETEAKLTSSRAAAAVTSAAIDAFNEQMKKSKL